MHTMHIDLTKFQDATHRMLLMVLLLEVGSSSQVVLPPLLCIPQHLPCSADLHEARLALGVLRTQE